MKFNRLVNIAFLLSFTVVFASCGLHEKLCAKTVKGPGEMSTEDLKKLAYLEKHKVSMQDLEEIPTTYWEGGCSISCCDEINFCGMPREDVLRYIENYRDSNWVQSSSFFQNHKSYNADQTMERIVKGDWGTSDPVYDEATSFDARFMDISIKQLNNYICFLQSTPQTARTNFCRFYYIRYDDDFPEETYRNKHSLAIVPVYVDPNHSNPAREMTETFKTREGMVVNPIFVINPEGCDTSAPINHNHLCPPFNNCMTNTLLEEVDGQ